VPIALGILHGLDYVFTFSLSGITIFYYLILPAGKKPAQDIFSDWIQKFRWVALAAVTSSSLWMLLVANDMTESWTSSDIWTAISLTSFGHIWCIKIILMILVVIFTKQLHRNSMGRGLLITVIMTLPLFSTLTGHAFSQTDHRLLRMSMDWIHSLFVGIWSGGLFALFVLLSRRAKAMKSNSLLSYQVVKRFSHFAMGSTAMIFLTGIAMAYLSGVDPLHPFLTTYSQIISVKLIAFFLALAFAAINQLVHLRKGLTEGEFKFAKNICREVRIEITVLFIIFILAAFLSRTSLPRG
jgi:copper transport protein